MQAGPGWLGRGGPEGLFRSWCGMRGLPRAAILDGALGRVWKAGVGFVFCLLLRLPIQAHHSRALANGWLLSVPRGQLGVPRRGVGVDARGFRHVAGAGCGGLGEYLPRRPNILGWR